jgi:hypothetical protein
MRPSMKTKPTIDEREAICTLYPCCTYQGFVKYWYGDIGAERNPRSGGNEPRGLRPHWLTLRRRAMALLYFSSSMPRCPSGSARWSARGRFRLGSYIRRLAGETWCSTSRHRVAVCHGCCTSVLFSVFEGLKKLGVRLCPAFHQGPVMACSSVVNISMVVVESTFLLKLVLGRRNRA